MRRRLMLRKRLAILAMGLLGGAAAPATKLTISRVVSDAHIPTDVIVGRAHCGASTWLLTDTAHLITVSTDTLTVGIRQVSGFTRDDNPWGLACLNDGTIWTLATARSLVRLDDLGQTHDRVVLPLPRTALFGAGDRVLFQQVPIVRGAAALATTPPSDPASVRTWPGLVSRRATTREQEIAQNLVNCGIGFAGAVPCWFVNETRFTVSDGRVARSIDVGSPPSSRSGDTPIRDIALASHSFWLLANSHDTDRGQLTGASLMFHDEPTAVRAIVNLTPPARLLLAVTDTNCWLLTTDGSLVEVTVTR
jgi:hypothetical protein